MGYLKVFRFLIENLVKYPSSNTGKFFVNKL